ncbi:MAG: hypothetical protein ACOYOK_03130 [Pseudobdellovibrionaceae bacterium]
MAALIVMSKKQKLILSGFFILSLVALVVASVPKWRMSVYNRLQSGERRVLLAKIQTPAMDLSASSKNDELQSSNNKMGSIINSRMTNKSKANGPHAKWLYLKVKQGSQIFLELYALGDAAGESSPRFITKIALLGSEDAYFNFKFGASNLALLDVNKDGVLDIVAPTYDHEQKTFLNALSFNSELNSFVPLSPPDEETLGSGLNH